MVPRWRIFGNVLHPVFSVSCMQHISDLYPKFALGPHHGMVDIQSAMAENRRGKMIDRRRRRETKPQDENIMACPKPNHVSKSAKIVLWLRAWNIVLNIVFKVRYLYTIKYSLICRHGHGQQQQQQQSFYGPLSGTTRVSWYQKIHSPTHHPDHHPIFISFLQCAAIVSIASAVLAAAIPSVRPSVRLSVTRRYCVKTTARSTVQFALLDSKMCLVL